MNHSIPDGMFLKNVLGGMWICQTTTTTTPVGVVPKAQHDATVKKLRQVQGILRNRGKA